jgi:hypothetical protein
VKIDWIAMVKNVPALKRAIDKLVEPGGSESETVWYNVAKGVFGVLAACGIAFAISDADLYNLVSMMPDVFKGVVALLTFCGFVLDAIYSIRLRMKTKEPLSAKVKKEQ